MVSNTLKYTQNPPHTRGIFCFKTIVIVLSLLFSCSSFSQAVIKFSDSKKNFGFVKKGEVVSLEYEFKNTGSEPLIITDAKFECSCTSVDYPKQPIPPNGSEKILVKFDTKSAYDRQDRTVEIISNAKNSPEKIRFKGIVTYKK